jgi:hypothetical protein
MVAIPNMEKLTVKCERVGFVFKNASNFSFTNLHMELQDIYFLGANIFKFPMNVFKRDIENLRT